MAHSIEEGEFHLDLSGDGHEEYDVDVPDLRDTSTDVPDLRDSTKDEDNAYIMVTALDFGTTYSGYAFSFKTTPNDIQMNKNWGEQVGFQSYKTPTCVLTDRRGEFVAFGYEAEDR